MDPHGYWTKILHVNLGKVNAIAVRDQVRVRMAACYACSVRCKKVVHIEEKEETAREASETLYKGRAKVAFDPLGRYRVDPRYGGPEYESLAALGVNLGLDDLIAICKFNEMCNYLGMDTVSLGATLAWAMECFEKGILTLGDTGGVPLRFHDTDSGVSARRPAPRPRLGGHVLLARIDERDYILRA